MLARLLVVALLALPVGGATAHQTASEAPEKPVAQTTHLEALKPSSKGVTQAYGAKNAALYGNGAHDGEDLANKCGDPVKSPTNGQVTAIGSSPIYGDHVWITGYDNAQHLLGHTAASAHVGDIVVRGTVVGTTNLSGKTTACHLHWTVKQGGKIVDPEAWLKEPEACPSLQGVPAGLGIHVCAASAKFTADPVLVASILCAENGCMDKDSAGRVKGWPAIDKYVCSPYACGLMQFTPGTWEEYKIDGDGGGSDKRSGVDQIYSAAHYIGKMKKNVRDTAITYNNSFANVGKPDSALPSETVRYLQRVDEAYAALRRK